MPMCMVCRDDEAYRQWAAYAQQQQYANYVTQANYDDYASQQAYVNQVNSYNQYIASQQNKANPGVGLKVAKTPSLVYMGDFEMGGYRHDITGGNDGGYNAPYDLNGDGQYVDNWGKVATQWKHKKGSAQLKAGGKKVQEKQSQLRQVAPTAKPATKGDKAELALEQRKLFALEEASKLQKLSIARGSALRQSIPDDAQWHAGYDDHPAAIPNEGAPFRPWYWKMTYDKYGTILP